MGVVFCNMTPVCIFVFRYRCIGLCVCDGRVYLYVSINILVKICHVWLQIGSGCSII